MKSAQSRRATSVRLGVEYLEVRDVPTTFQTAILVIGNTQNTAAALTQDQNIVLNSSSNLFADYAQTLNGLHQKVTADQAALRPDLVAADQALIAQVNNLANNGQALLKGINAALGNFVKVNNNLQTQLLGDLKKHAGNDANDARDLTASTNGTTAIANAANGQTVVAVNAINSLASAILDLKPASGNPNGFTGIAYGPDGFASGISTSNLSTAGGSFSADVHVTNAPSLQNGRIVLSSTSGDVNFAAAPITGVSATGTVTFHGADGTATGTYTATINQAKHIVHITLITGQGFGDASGSIFNYTLS